MLFSKVLSEGGKQARLAQSVERQALNLVVGGSSPPVGDSFFPFLFQQQRHGDKHQRTPCQTNRERRAFPLKGNDNPLLRDYG